MGGTLSIRERRNPFPQLRARDKKKAAALEEKHTKATADLMKQLVPVSSINTPGYQHLRDAIEAKKLPRGWAILKGKPYFDFVDKGNIYFEGYNFSAIAIESGKSGLRNDLQSLGYRRK
jgi:hypothetical protein